MSATPMQVRQWSEEVARDPGNLAFLPLAEAYRAQGRRDAALRLCIRGLERNPENVEAHHLLGVLYLEGGEQLKAFDEWDIALRLSPEHRAARRAIGMLCVERADWAAAARHLERAAADVPDDGDLRSALDLARTNAAVAAPMARPGPAPASTASAGSAAPASPPSADSTVGGGAGVSGVGGLGRVGGNGSDGGAGGVSDVGGSGRVGGIDGIDETGGVGGVGRTGGDGETVAGSNVGGSAVSGGAAASTASTSADSVRAAETARSTGAAGAGSTVAAGSAGNAGGSASTDRPMAAGEAGAGAGAAAGATTAGPPRWDSLQDEFAALGAERGVVGAILLDGQGYVIAGEMRVDGRDRAPEVAAVLSGASSEAERAVKHLGMGTWRGILLETPQATVRLAPVADGGMLAVAARREVPTGWVLRLAARARDAAARWLGAGGGP